MSQVKFPDNINKYEALINLWNATKACGLGILHSHNQPTIKDAKEYLLKQDSVDYFFGKPIKCNFKTYPVLNRFGYDRDAGNGTMQKVAYGCATHIGPTKELNSAEKTDLINNCNKSINVDIM